MRSRRVIARLDIKGPNLIKGVKLEGLRKMGAPFEFSEKYYQQGIDELIYMDTVASLYGRNNLTDIVKRTAENVFIPITVGGGIRSIEDANKLLKVGADKVAINTAATRRPELIKELSEEFGSQCVVLSVEAQILCPGKWEVYIDNGREKTGRDVVEWVQQAVELGAGEILLTSVDNEGTLSGYDVDLIHHVTQVTNTPIIASGGMGSLDHIQPALIDADVDALAIAHVFHYNKISIKEVKAEISRLNVNLREVE